jgi:hypothetical protein
MTDTTPEAVDAHIDRIDPHGYAQPKSLNDDTKTLLRALSADLEAEKDRHAKTVQIGIQFAADAAMWKARTEKAEAERDELKAHNRYLSGEYDVVLAGRADEHDRAEAAEAERDALSKACTEWSEVSQLNYQRAKAAEAEVARLRDVLSDIAKQKRTDELETVLDVEYADFEGGYDDCINRARAAIQKENKT